MHYLTLAASVAVLAGCSKQEPAQIDRPGTEHEVYLSVRASSDDTRTSISSDYAIRWAKGDAIGLFYNAEEILAEQDIYGSTNFNGNIQNLKYGITSGAGSVAATFACEQDKEHEHPFFPYTGNFKWKSAETSQTTIYAYTPYRYDSGCGSNYNVNYMPFSLPGVQQGSLESVAVYDLACASATIMRGEGDVVRGEADFRFRHLFSILEITVENTLPDAVTVESVAVSAAEGTALTGDCTVNLTTGEVTMGQRANQSGTFAGTVQPSVVMEPAAAVTLQSGEVAKLYAVVAPGNLSGAAVRVTTSGGYQEFAVSGITTSAGNYYTKRVAISSLTPNPTIHTIDFEDVKLGKENYTGMVGNQTYENILTARSLDHGDWTGEDFTGWSGPIYTTSDGRAVFIGYYNDFGGYMATWGAFAFSANSHDAFVFDYAYQFCAMTSDRSANKFAVTYDIYASQTDRVNTEVDFTSPINPVSVDVTNTPLMGDHMGEDPAVTFVGYLNGEKGSEVTFSLVDVDEWTEVDLRMLGTIDRMVVNMSGDRSRTPFYVCLDNLKYTEAE